VEPTDHREFSPMQPEKTGMKNTVKQPAARKTIFHFIFSWNSFLKSEIHSPGILPCQI